MRYAVRPLPLLIGAFPVEGHERIVAELVEPGAHERVAAAELVVEERERQPAVERLHPERDAGQLHGQRIDVDAVEAVLDYGPADDRFEPLIKPLGGQRPISFRKKIALHRCPVARAFNAVVDVERFDDCTRESAQRRYKKTTRAHRWVADLEGEKLFGRPDFIGGVGQERLERAADRRHRELGPRVERAGSLPGATPPDEIEFAWKF